MSNNKILIYFYLEENYDFLIEKIVKVYLLGVSDTIYDWFRSKDGLPWVKWHLQIPAVGLHFTSRYYL